MSRHAVLLVSLVFAPSLAAAQSLADVARATEKRREVSKGAIRTYTNEDLVPSARRVTSASPESEMAHAALERLQTIDPGAVTAEPPAPIGTAKPALGLPPEAHRDEQYWRERIREARAALERSEVLVEALRSRINALMADFAGRDDPVQRSLVELDSRNAAAELERLVAHTERLRGEVAATQEEARRAAVPPGWLR